MAIRIVTLLLLLLPMTAGLNSLSAQERDAPSRAKYILEGYPVDLAVRLEIRDRQFERHAQDAGIPEVEAVVTIGKLWRHSPITVAFRGGDKQLQGKIADAATEWTKHGSFKFDFGHDEARDTYRQWSLQDDDFAADIRISFDDRGYYSLVGTDSRDPAIVRPQEASMNFDGFNVTLPADWQGTVLHEFGHALGLQHEHQHPEQPCDFRFDDDSGYRPTRDQFGQFIPDSRDRRPGLYTSLAGPPNNWSRAVVDHNLKQLPNSRALFQTEPFDAMSIMKYHFPSWMFKAGAQSTCASDNENAALSEGDRKSIARAYPAAPTERRQIDTIRQQRQELLGELEALALPKLPSTLETVTSAGLERSSAVPLKERLSRIRRPTPGNSALESPTDQAISTTPRDKIPQERDALERVIEDPDFLPANFIVTGGSRQSSVGRIAFKATFTHPEGGTFFPDDGWGTGFLVSPSLLLTNNHVLEKSDFTANKVRIQFNYQRRLSDGAIDDVDSYDFDPTNFFYTNAALDFTLVRVKGKPASPATPGAPLQAPGSRWGHYTLANSMGIDNTSFFERMSLNVIQHPAGRPKEVAIHNNFLDRLLPDHIRYTTDTEGGSSGSPVFDNQWVVFALHHSAGDLNTDGTWKNNEGVRIDKIIQHIINASAIPSSVKVELGIQ